jgi:hypothetical protein
MFMGSKSKGEFTALSTRAVVIMTTRMKLPEEEMHLDERGVMVDNVLQHILTTAPRHLARNGSRESWVVQCRIGCPGRLAGS